MKIERCSIAETFNICRMRTYNHPSAEDLTLERIFQALSDPVRLDIVRHLSRVTEATCGELDGGRPSRACPTTSAYFARLASFRHVSRGPCIKTRCDVLNWTPDSMDC